MSAEAERPQQRLEQMDTTAKGIISARPACGSVWFHRQARAAQKGYNPPPARRGPPLKAQGTDTLFWLGINGGRSFSCSRLRARCNTSRPID
jgi:hypothetical protein